MKKRIFYNSKFARAILFDGYSTIMLFGFILTKQSTLSAQTINHESIHVRQWLECSLLALPLILLSWWLIPVVPIIYYIWYLVEYLVRLILTQNSSEAYRNIVFEREAYRNQSGTTYLKRRMPFQFLKNYIP